MGRASPTEVANDVGLPSSRRCIHVRRRGWHRRSANARHLADADGRRCLVRRPMARRMVDRTARIVLDRCDATCDPRSVRPIARGPGEMRHRARDVETGRHASAVRVVYRAGRPDDTDDRRVTRALRHRPRGGPATLIIGRRDLREHRGGARRPTAAIRAWQRRPRRRVLRGKGRTPGWSGPGVQEKAYWLRGSDSNHDLRVMSPTSCRCSTPRPGMIGPRRLPVKRPPRGRPGSGQSGVRCGPAGVPLGAPRRPSRR